MRRDRKLKGLLHNFPFATVLVFIQCDLMIAMFYNKVNKAPINIPKINVSIKINKLRGNVVVTEVEANLISKSERRDLSST